MHTFFMIWYFCGVLLSVAAITEAVHVSHTSRKWCVHNWSGATFVAACGFSVFPVLNFITAFALLAVVEECKDEKK